MQTINEQDLDHESEEQIADDYILVTDDISNGEYELVNKRLTFFYTGAYRPSQLNEIISRLYNEKYKFITRLSHDDLPGSEIDIFQAEDKKIILFPAVVDYEFGQTSSGLTTLEDTIKFYKEVFSHTPEDLVIIPVAETARRHFRLLVLQNSTITYYDPKGYLYTHAMNKLAPLLPAWIAAKQELTDILSAREAILSEMISVRQKTLSSLAENKEKTFYEKVDEKVGGISLAMKFLYILSEITGHAIYETARKYPDYANYVRHTCLHHFPNTSFNERTMGHQSFSEATNCGPLVANYADRIAAGEEPHELGEDMFEMRARFDTQLPEEFSKTVCTNDDSEGMTKTNFTKI